jgi:hypothetical protein
VDDEGFEKGPALADFAMKGYERGGVPNDCAPEPPTAG